MTYNIYFISYIIYYILYKLYDRLYIMYYILCVLPPGSNWASATPRLSLFSMAPIWTPTKWVKVKNMIFFGFCSVKNVIYVLFCSANMSFWPVPSKALEGSIPGLEHLVKKSNAMVDLKHSIFLHKDFCLVNTIRAKRIFFSGKIGLQAGSVLEL